MAFSRRDFLKRTCCTAAAGFAAASFNRFGLVNALAQSAQDYKALVCVFLFGGNDSNNMVVPLSSARIQPPTSRSARCWPCRRRVCCPSPRPARVPFGFHPRFTEMQALFNQKHLAVLANVGTLVRPTTRAQYPAASGHPPAEPFLARRPAGADADRHPRTATDRRDGRGERRTRFNPFTAAASPLSFRWRAPIFFARA